MRALFRVALKKVAVVKQSRNGASLGLGKKDAIRKGICLPRQGCFQGARSGAFGVWTHKPVGIMGHQAGLGGSPLAPRG